MSFLLSLIFFSGHGILILLSKIIVNIFSAFKYLFSCLLLVIITGPPFLKHSICSKIRHVASCLLLTVPPTYTMHSESVSASLSDRTLICAPLDLLANSLMRHPSNYESGLLFYYLLQLIY